MCVSVPCFVIICVYYAVVVCEVSNLKVECRRL